MVEGLHFLFNDFGGVRYYRRGKWLIGRLGGSEVDVADWLTRLESVALRQRGKKYDLIWLFDDLSGNYDYAVLFTVKINCTNEYK